MSVSLMLSLKIVLNKISLKINCTFDETSRTETFFTHILERKTLKLAFYKLTSLVLVNKIMALIAVKMRFFLVREVSSNVQLIFKLNLFNTIFKDNIRETDIDLGLLKIGPKYHVKTYVLLKFYVNKNCSRDICTDYINPNNPVVILRPRWSLHLAIVPIEGAILFELDIDLGLLKIGPKYHVKTYVLLKFYLMSFQWYIMHSVIFFGYSGFIHQ
jgi:hypothetical protein